MAGAPQQDQGKADNSYYILWIMAIIVVIAVIIWHVWGRELALFFIGLRKIEIGAVYYTFSYLFEHLPNNIPYVSEFVQNWAVSSDVDYTLALEQTPETISMDVAELLSERVGIYWRVPFSILLIYLGYYTFTHHIYMRFRKKYDMKSLLKQEAVNWPQVQVVTKIDLVEEDLDSGPWAMAMTPLQFAKKLKLYTLEVPEKVGSGMGKIKTAEYVLKVDRPRAKRAFAAQLGRPWTGIENMFDYRRALFAVFIARIARDTKASLALMSQLASSAAAGKLNLDGADKLWQKHIQNKLVQQVLQAHAYEFTLFASLILKAREDGVVPSSDYLWVKPLDRRLWFVLNNVGRQTPHAEVGGIFCHWDIEMLLKRPLSVPMVDEAVDALQNALNEVLYTPDDEEREAIAKGQGKNVSSSLSSQTGDNQP